MTPETLNALEIMFKKTPAMCGNKVDRMKVDDLEKEIGFKLAGDYKLFVEQFGGAIVGPFSIYGLNASKAMGINESSALEVTTHFRSEGWVGTDQWLIISMDHAGNPIGLDVNGKIWISDHDAGIVKVIALSFEEYLRKWCLKIDP